MKNIIEEKPGDELHGRTLYNTNFVDDEDVKSKSILDVGCGFGWMELDLLKRGAERITGMEISREDLETAKKYISDPKINFEVGGATELPFKNEVFNTVVAWEVIEHIPSDTEDKMFQEVNRVLKPNGVFYLSTPYNSLFAKIFDPAWWLIGHRHYSKEKLISLAEKNGFSVEKIVVNGAWWEVFGMLNLYIAKWIFRRRPFWNDLVNIKQNNEYKKESGFTNIFIKIRKSKV